MREPRLEAGAPCDRRTTPAACGLRVEARSSARNRDGLIKRPRFVRPLLEIEDVAIAIELHSQVGWGGVGLNDREASLSRSGFTVSGS